MVSVCYQVQKVNVLDNHFHLDSLASGVYAAVGLVVHPQQTPETACIPAQRHGERSPHTGLRACQLWGYTYT
jgi:hypothetical protein